MTEQQVKHNINLYYISEIIFGTYFQLAIWIVYQANVMKLSFEQIAFYASVAVIVELVMQVPTGAFADVFGRKLALSIGNLFYALPMFIIAIWPRPEVMWIYSIIWGTGRAFASGPDQAIIFDSLKAVDQEHQFAKINSRAGLSFQISAAVSILIGTYLYQVSPALPYYVSGFASLIGVFTSFLYKEHPTDEPRSKFKIIPFLKTNLTGIKEIFKNSYLTKLSLLFIFISGIASPNQKFFSQPYMVEIGMNDLERGWVSTIIKIVITIIGVWFVSKKKIFEHKRFIFILPLLMIISLIPSEFAVYPFTYLIILGVAFTSGNVGMFMTPLFIKHVDSKVRTTALSAVRMFSVLIYAILTYISGPIIEKSSTGHFFFLEGIFTILVILPLTILVFKHKNKT